MKTLDIRKWQTRLTQVLTAIGLCLIVGLPGYASDAEDNDDNPGGNGGGGFGDETVGTLPIVTGGSGTMEDIGPLGLMGFLFSIRGDTGTLQDVILDAYGDGHVVLDSFPDDEVRLTFFGNVSIIFDPSVIQSLDVRTDIIFGRDFLQRPAAIVTSDWTSPVFTLPANGMLDLPLSRIERIGLLDSGRMGVHALSLYNNRSTVGLSTWGGLLVVNQVH